MKQAFKDIVTENVFEVSGKVFLQILRSCKLQWRFVEIFIFYSWLKGFLWHLKITPNTFIKVLLPVIAIGWAISYWSLITVFYLHHTIIMFFLKLKYGKENLRTLHGNDLIFMPEKKSIVNPVMFVKHSNPELFNKQVIERVNNLLKEVPKLLFIRQRLLLTTYLIKKELPMSEYIKTLDIPSGCSKDKFMEKLDEIYKMEMPENDNGLFQIYIGNNVIWNNTIPILFRIHHVFGDGVAIQNTFARHFFDFNLQCEKILPIINNNLLLDVIKKDASANIFDWINKLDKKLLFTILPLSNKIPNGFLRQTLAGARLSDFQAINKTELFQKTKLIQTACSSTVVSIISTVFGKALEDYINKYNLEKIDTADMAYCVYPKRIPTDKYGLETHYTNRVIFSKLNIAVCEGETLLDKLRITAENHKFVNTQTIDVEAMQAAYAAFGVAFSVFDKLSKNFVITGIGSTNLPGLAYKPTLKGNLVEDMLMMGSPLYHAGLVLTTYTFADNMYFILSTDTAIVSSRDRLKFILHRIIVNIQSLYDEAVNYKKC